VELKGGKRRKKGLGHLWGELPGQKEKGKNPERISNLATKGGSPRGNYTWMTTKRTDSNPIGGRELVEEEWVILMKDPNEVISLQKPQGRDLG